VGKSCLQMYFDGAHPSPPAVSASTNTSLFL
jgi:hypothetical protein